MALRSVPNLAIDASAKRALMIAVVRRPCRVVNIH